MGFRQGAYARFWTVEDKGNYSVARISISKKNKNTDAFIQEFQDGFVRLVGNAHEAFKGVSIDSKKGITAKITSCDVTNVYTSSDGNVSYNPHYTIFGLEIQDNNGNTNNKGSGSKSVNKDNGSDGFMNIPDGIDEELPFN